MAHGQGYTGIRHRRGDLEVTATWCVDANRRVKQVALRLVNRGRRTLHLRLIGIAEWMMGASRRTAPHGAHRLRRLPRQRRAGAAVTASSPRCWARSATAPGVSAAARPFLRLAGGADEAEDWTCDRREFFDARGRLVLPDHWASAAAAGWTLARRCPRAPCCPPATATSGCSCWAMPTPRGGARLAAAAATARARLDPCALDACWAPSR
ncbi:hypothetical protein [Candidatus Skiveiella danica]|uniref:hypothetical protein n=1 Tax=Candidatus Skiveiella danica TaxID=3386177 RepID=UPI001DE536B6|nr:hypothetical protein [Betaproteobacteria bacterium]